MEGKEVTDNARTHYKSGKRTHVNRHDDHFLKKIALLLEGARPVAVVQRPKPNVAVRTWLLRSRAVVYFASIPCGGGAPRLRRLPPTTRPQS
eukprot:4346410-Pleurochrysis_carterae.AAC.1